MTKFKGKCNYCHRVGHKEANCRTKMSKQNAQENACTTVVNHSEREKDTVLLTNCTNWIN